MDSFEKAGYIVLGLVAILYAIALVVGMIAVFPFGLIGLAIIVGMGSLFIKVLKDRLTNKEDDYYSDHVEK